MAKYTKGDHVSWNSEAGWASGRIKTDHIAAHREHALKKVD